MRIVQVRMQFLTPCLGNVNDNKIYKHIHDSQGRTIFMQSWWSSLMTRAAAAHGRYQNEAANIQFDPVVDGYIKIYRRYYKPKKYRKHEAFLAGDEVGISALVPSEIPTEEFEQLMAIAGRYFGISPYGWHNNSGSGTADVKADDKGFGRFDIVEVNNVRMCNKDRENRGIIEDKPGR